MQSALTKSTVIPRSGLAEPAGPSFICRASRSGLQVKGQPDRNSKSKTATFQRLVNGDVPDAIYLRIRPQNPSLAGAPRMSIQSRCLACHRSPVGRLVRASMSFLNSVLILVIRYATQGLVHLVQVWVPHRSASAGEKRKRSAVSRPTTITDGVAAPCVVSFFLVANTTAIDLVMKGFVVLARS